MAHKDTNFERWRSKIRSRVGSKRLRNLTRVLQNRNGSKRNKARGKREKREDTNSRRENEEEEEREIRERSSDNGSEWVSPFNKGRLKNEKHAYFNFFHIIAIYSLRVCGNAQSSPLLLDVLYFFSLFYFIFLICLH